MNSIRFPALHSGRPFYERRHQRRITILTTLLLACLGMTGCVSVPLSTMVRMSTFGTDDFVQLNPDVVRVRIKLPQGFVLNAAKSWLGVRITSEVGIHHGTFKLEQVAQEETTLSKGMFAKDVLGTAYTLRLSAASEDDFRKLQAFVSRGRPGDIIISVAPILSSFPSSVPSVTVWIDLLLEQQKGFFTLLDAAEVPMDQIRAANTEG